MEHTIAFQLVIVLAAGTALVALFQRIGFSPILGYIATGVLAGPSVMGWFADTPLTHVLGELGVVLLMFTVGLEFSLSRLLAARRLVLGLGSAQILFTALLFGLLAWWWWDALPVEAFVFGGALAMSSTALVLKQLSEQLELPMPHGRAAAGVLLVQDLAALAILVALPILAADPNQLPGALTYALGRAVLIFIGLVFVGRRLLPPLLHWIAETRSLELFMLTALLLAVAAAAAAVFAGLTPALGAFMAGLLLGETPFRHQMEADIRPFRDLMLGLFFVTIGMQLEPATFLGAPGTIMLVLAALIVGKAVIMVPLVRAFGHSTIDARRTAITLAQGGEFGLLVISSALALGLLEAGRAQPLLGGLIASMALAPVLVRFNGRIAAWAAPDEMAPMDRETEAQIAEASDNYDQHVIVCGYGRLGQNLVRILTDEGIPALALDTDPERIRQAAAAGQPVLFGNALQPGVLRAAGIDRVRALVVTLEDAAIARRIVNHARWLNGRLPVLARSAHGRNEEELTEAGATVFPEGLEASLAFAGQLLIMLGVPASRVETRMNAIRADDYTPLRAFFHDSMEHATSADAQDYPKQVRAVIVDENHHAAGRTPQELGLVEDGIELIDVRRGAIRVPGRLLDTRLRPGDVLLLRGTRDELERATACLVEGA